MNDATKTAEVKEEKSEKGQAQSQGTVDFFEFGAVSEKTAGSVIGSQYDGGVGFWG